MWMEDCCRGRKLASLPAATARLPHSRRHVARASMDRAAMGSGLRSPSPRRAEFTPAGVTIVHHESDGHRTFPDCQAAERVQRALGGLPTGDLPAGLFCEPHKPSRRAGAVGEPAQAIAHLTRPVAARDYWEQSRFRRFVAGSLNALLIDRENIKVHKSPVELMLRAIGNTHSLIVFPEGSRSQDEEMGEFKSGLYYLGKKRPDLELVPVYIENLNRVLPRGEFLPVPLLSSITIGAPIWLEAGEGKTDFLRRAQESVRRLKDI